MREPKTLQLQNFRRIWGGVWNKKTLLFIVLSLPVFVYCASFLFTGTMVAGGDGDYLMQTQEAMRRSILEFHQFPWWNPWVSGGVPLFANPQFGLISIVTPFTLVFGSVLGYKLALFTLFLLGFWGLYRLFRTCFKTPFITAVLLAYIWTFGTFLAHRLEGGHYTFFTIQFFPWALMFYLQRNNDKWAWLKFGLTISLMALSAAHNMTIMAYMVLGLILLFETVRASYRKKQLHIGITLPGTDLAFWAKAGGLFIVLTGYRLLYTFQYLQDFPRLNQSPETTIGLGKAALALFAPFIQFDNSPSLPQWSWLEASAYIGICTLLVTLLILTITIRRRRELSKLFSYSPYIIGGLLLVFLLLALGGFAGKLSPYLILRELPIFSSMRVATRWLPWLSLFILIFIAAYRAPYFRRVINVLLLISVVELFMFSRPHLAEPYITPLTDVRSASAPFEQKRHYNVHRWGVSYDENLTDATRNNYGQIIAGDALVDTRFKPPAGVNTIRCSIDEGCPFVMTKNAKLVQWSPNKIILERTGKGDIRLNANPGKYWLVNGKYVFDHLKVVDASRPFLIDTPSKKITIEYVPRFSPEWIMHELR